MASRQGLDALGWTCSWRRGRTVCEKGVSIACVSVRLYEEHG
jgi:hypothetical protein